MVCVSYKVSVLVLADPVHLYAVLAHLCECSCAVRLRIGLRAEVHEVGCLLKGDAFEVLLVVLPDDRRRVVTDDGREPVAVTRADHCVHWRVALVCTCELDFVRAVLQDDYRRLLKLLYSAATVGGIDGSCEVLVCVRVQRLRYEEPFLACLRRKVFRCCPAEQPKLRRTYAEVHVPSGTLCIVQLPQQYVRLLWLQRREVTVVAPVGEPWDHATLPTYFLLSLVRACYQFFWFNQRNFYLRDLFSGVLGILYGKTCWI